MARDKGIEKLVARGLRRQAASRGPSPEASGPSCLDAETLAAYVERTLTPEEKTSCEAHLSSCLHCQEQVAQLVRAGEGERELEPSQTARHVEASRVGLPSFRWVWAAPALVGVIIAGLWYTGEFRPLLRTRHEGLPPTSAAPPAAPPPSLAGVKAKGGAPASPQKVEPREKHLATTAARKEAKAPAQIPTAPPVMAPPSERARLAGAGLASAGRAAGGTSQADLQKAPPAPTGPPQSTVRPPLNVPDLATARRRERGVGSAGAVMPKAAAKSASVAPAMDSFASTAGRWRVGPHGLIEKLGPQGEWVQVESGVKTHLFAISFSTPAVGWAVGAGGTVLRTSDGGITWTKLAFPTTDDLIYVSSEDGQHARVQTRAGRSFLTADGGQSWTPAD